MICVVNSNTRRGHQISRGLRGKSLHHPGPAGQRVFVPPLEEGLANGEGSLGWRVETTQRSHIDHDVHRDSGSVRYCCGIIRTHYFPFLWCYCLPLYSLSPRKRIHPPLPQERAAQSQPELLYTLSTLAASRDAVSMYPRVSFLLKRRFLRPARSSSSMSSKFVRDSADSFPLAKTTSCHRHGHRRRRT